ncbi:cyanophycin synthetase [Nibrella saemangeumensis]|uniref:Cyanophycin synthetase n=1 Tax=Nibrella saemangeumensis TaxID=1084526 RepID=A0ABP8MG50_9BACT
MKILDIRCLRGPNYWSVRKHKLIALRLDLEQLEENPTNKIDGFYERLRQLIPSLHSHECSEGRPGGFFFRVETGTWMGHVIEHIALEIQTLAGMSCGYGRTRGTGEQGIYNVIFEFQEERAGLYAAGCAVDIAQALIAGTPYDIDKTIAALRDIGDTHRLGPSTSAIVEACVHKGVPFRRLDEDSLVQLGYGTRQKRIVAAVSNETSCIATELAADKNLTKKILENAGVPVPAGEVITDQSELKEVIQGLGYPVVVKPLDGNHGRGVTTNIQRYEEAVKAFRCAKSHSERVVVEQFMQGNDYRILVVNYKVYAVGQRIPACVTGNGVSTIQELIDAVNLDPRRGDGHQNLLTRIEVDDATMCILKQQHLTLESVLPAGQTLYLKKTANLSTGGTAIDKTDEIHPEITFMAERTARIIGLDICGIDLIAEDISLPLKQANAAVIEVNAGPGLRMHTHPSEGKARDVGKAIADMLFPGEQNGRIPIIAITGTNGKTTTTRLTAHIVRQAGFSVGYTTTDGVYIGNFQIEEGDCTGFGSCSKVLMDPTVDFAVLECARGGLLRSGLAFDQCDVGVVTNVASDHLGLNNIHTLEDLAHVKSVIPETVKPDGYTVLNADNDYTYDMRNRVECHVALFSTDPNSERIQAHCQQGGLAAVYENGFVTILKGNERFRIEQATNIPLSFDGKAIFMVENILAASLAAYCQGIPTETIAEGLRTFVPSDQNTPGRMNQFTFNDFTVLVDYAHNPHGLLALGHYIKQVGTGPKVGIITGVGDRRDEDIIELGRVAAGLFDEIIVRLDEDRRGREADNIVNLIKTGIHEVTSEKSIICIPDELKAIDHAIRHARPGSLIVHLTEKVAKSVEIVRGFKELEDSYSRSQEVMATI